jgi:acetolactate synthase-1/2/3 large subunit
MTAGALVVRSLEQHGVDVVFGIPGTHNLPIYAALADGPIRHVTPRHEQGAGYAADGYARASGRPGVVIATTGPGALNAATAAAQAWSDSVPLLLIAPGMPLAHPAASTGYLHEMLDQRLALSGVVEHAVRVETHAELAREVADAFGAFAGGRPRARYIEVPLDLLACEERSAVVLAPSIRPRSLAPDAVGSAAGMLSVARRPLVIAGGGSHGAAGELAELLDRGVPVITTINGKGVVDERHPLALGARLPVAAGRRLAEEADVLVVVGSDLGQSDHWSTLEPEGFVVRVDIDPAQAHGNVPAGVPLVSDAQVALRSILDRLDNGAPHPGPEWIARRERADAEARELGRPWAGLTAAVESVLGPGDVVTADNAMVAYNALLGSLRMQAGGRFMFPSGFGTLGYALPAAIGAMLARPDRRVVAVHGDGGIMFSLPELATAVELGLSLPVVVSLNGGYGEIRREMVEQGIEPLAVDLGSPDLPAAARALGGHGEALKAPGELGDALEAAFACSGPTVITVPEA